MTLTRHQIRERAFQMLFALNANPEADQDALYQRVLTDDPNQTVPVPAYLTTLVQGVLTNQAELDAQIDQYLSTGWQLKRIAKTDLVIMRIAFFEIEHVEEVPNRVAVNEALELAKNFSDDRSRRFINGVLAHTLDGDSADSQA
ncbi:transcription antitermination factor NusB [Levilactobacillus tujiorum]|uniref:Transcription antitermination protein NusB n=1 Tax=Levilactobacillus tujiorum TaxID=2912243 RepID=A0ABX1L5M1_9LACO|nr:transcription antitermination factor NusB [Levilactobacillus tujiorum]NLR12852.1 transcription antitermination factor NusB [Lactobacillus sp. HBUAS51387]NLR29573.1 transcription antitermination factor NusB [Levilactobacillus tujiorum]NLR31290.1 transcription antitermination factor NusB [Levilactobacillus tujiorum]